MKGKKLAIKSQLLWFQYINISAQGTLNYIEWVKSYSRRKDEDRLEKINELVILFFLCSVQTQEISNIFPGILYIYTG